MTPARLVARYRSRKAEAARLELALQRVRDEADQALVALSVEHGWTLRRIAQAVGVSHQLVARIVARSARG